MAVWSDLFGQTVLIRQWGHIGGASRQRLDPFPDLGAALNAIADLSQAKRRRGYAEVNDPPPSKTATRAAMRKKAA
jgi:predicted DNA-binding WGR domain protein